MVSSAQAGKALSLLARFIEERAAERVQEVACDRDIIALAVERCAGPVDFCRAIEIGTVLSSLMDRLDWDGASKLVCRELLVVMAQRDQVGILRARARSGRLN